MSDPQDPSILPAYLSAGAALGNVFVSLWSTRKSSPVAEAVDAIVEANESNDRLSGHLNDRFKETQEQLSHLVKAQMDTLQWMKEKLGEEWGDS